jgi:hypothetical protein
MSRDCTENIDARVWALLVANEEATMPKLHKMLAVEFVWRGIQLEERMCVDSPTCCVILLILFRKLPC